MKFFPSLIKTRIINEILNKNLYNKMQFQYFFDGQSIFSEAVQQRGLEFYSTYSYLSVMLTYFQVPVGNRTVMDRLSAPARLMIVSDLDHTMVGRVIV